MSRLPSASDHQIRAADPGLSVFVTANAGSGKTSTLVNRVARLLLQDVAPGEILCVTYTKAAAAEMQARLFETLGHWAVMDDHDLSASLGRLDGREPASLTEADLTAARSMFARALETPGGLKIQTIHAFCEKLLRRFPIEAGVSPRFTVLENEAALALSRQARDDLARAAFQDPEGLIGQAFSHFAVALDWKAFQSLLGMIETQRESLTDYIDRVDAGDAPGPYPLAGADSGRSASELESEFMAFLDREVWDETATAMMGGSSNDQGCATRMRAATWTFTGISDVFLTEKGSQRKSMATAKADRDAAAWLEDLQMKYCATLNAVRAARVAEDTARLLTLARVHAAFYEAAKTARGALDFPDLVTRAVRLLTQNGAAAWVLYKLDGGIEHVLIDEAQDTAPDQWSIVHALTDEFFSGEGGPRRGAGPRIPRTVFAVGDEKQSIYSFQGARPERLRQEAQRFTSLVVGAELAFQHVPLDTSYRSTEEVLGFVDAVFHSPERTRALVGDTGDRIQHHPARVGQQGSIELWPLFEDEKAPERDAWLDPVDLESSTGSRKRLAMALAGEIKRQVETGVAVHARGDDGQPTLRPCGYGDFLILVRRRDGTFEEIIRALKTLGVPVAGADRLKLSTHIVFDDLIALARFALFPEDDLSLAGLLRSPLCDVPDFVGDDSLYALAGREKRDGLWRELQRRGDEQPAWNRARALMDFAIDSRNRDPFAFFAGVLNRVDETGMSGRARILARLGREAEEAIDETLAQVLSAEDRGATDLETCVAMLESADVEVKREMDGARSEVRVMTVHGAKGLEAPIVILPDTTSRSKPQGPSLMPVVLDDGSEGWLMCPGAEAEDCDASRDTRQARIDRADAESLRLLYVALTRARDRVVILGRALGNRKEGFEEGSWWDVLSETFMRLQADDGTSVRDIGDGRLRYGVAPVVALRTGSTAPVGVEIPDWARTLPASDPAARFVSPSQMQGGIRIPAPSPLAVVGEGLGRFRRGDLIHRLLERLPDIPAADRPDAAQRILAREPDLTPDQRTEMIEAAFGVLDDDRFAPVFGEGSRAEVALTGSAPGLPPGVSVSGRIDRLVITPERVLIVDYKTNRPAPQRIEDADPAYVLQLAIYRAVLQQLYPDRAVEAALVWTDGPQLMAIPGAMMDIALTGTR